MPTLWNKFMTGMIRGYRAFREEFLTSDAESAAFDADFGTYGGRRVRYAILWSTYENDLYRGVHDWATSYKTRYGLYKYIRSIYSPGYRLGEFWKTHLWGGELDVIDGAAGTKGCLPILTDNEAIREPIAQLWRWSNWHTVKDTITLNGAVLGDAFLRVCDNPEAGRIYLEYVNPATVAEVVKDDRGNIKGYTLQELKPHPDTGKEVEFREVVTNEGGLIVYQTYLNNSLYAWNGIKAEWDEPYGFVPMVHIMHNDTGREWGWSEFHSARSKIHEVDDLASMLSDQARKSINAKWVITGAEKPTANSGNITLQGTAATTRKPEPGREDEAALYIKNENAKIHPMVAPLDIPGVVEHITEILKELERDYPELKFDALRASGAISGSALRIARQPAESKVNQRRAGYDDGLVRAQQMALSIGGMRGYFQGVNEGSFAAGELDHNIGKRPVFQPDSFEQKEEEGLFWTNAKLVIEAGGDLAGWLEKQGWSEDDIALVVPKKPEPAPPPQIIMQPQPQEGIGNRTDEMMEESDGPQ
jgi:hypothetical protein